MALIKSYKADLKLRYKKYIEISLIISLAIIISAFKYFPNIQIKKRILNKSQELVKVEDVINTIQKTIPPPPPKPLIPIESPIADVLEDVEIQSTELDVNKNIKSMPPPKREENKIEEEKKPVFFIAVEEMPEPIGGIEGIQKRIVYPEIAKRAGIQGKVYVKAFVDEKGIVKRVLLLKGIGAGCDEAAMKAVKETRFKPGKQRGRPVKVQVTVPVLFKLRNNV